MRQLPAKTKSGASTGLAPQGGIKLSMKVEHAKRLDEQDHRELVLWAGDFRNTFAQ
jgi:hypothetical protein